MSSVRNTREGAKIDEAARLIGEEDSLTLGFCITSHGLGHTTRAIALMQALQQIAPEIRFAIANTAAKQIFDDSGIRNFRLLEILVDPGLVQSDALNLDLSQTLNSLAQAKLMEKTIARQLGCFFSGSSAIISDIAPIGLKIAKDLGLLGILVENFRWDWVYAQFDPSFRAYADARAVEYAEVDLHIQTEPICQRVDTSHQFGIFSRRQFRERTETRSSLGISEDSPCVLLSLGGVSPDEILLEVVDFPEEFIWLVPTSFYQMPARVGPVHFLPNTYYHPDLVAAADVVVGKIGYSTIAEIATAGTRFAYYSREWFPETARLAEYVKASLCSVALQGSLAESRSEILSLLNQPLRAKVPNEVDAAAQLIVDHLAGNRESVQG